MKILKLQTLKVYINILNEDTAETLDVIKFFFKFLYKVFKNIHQHVFFQTGKNHRKWLFMIKLKENIRRTVKGEIFE